MPQAVTRSPSFKRSLALAEIVVTAAEATVVGIPALVLLHGAVDGSGVMLIVGPAAVVLWAGTVGRLVIALRPVLRVRAAKRRNQAIGPAEADAAQRAIARVPVESAALHVLCWVLGVSAVAAVFLRRGSLTAVVAAGAIGVAAIHAGAAGAARSLLLERILERMQRWMLPNLDPLRAFAARYAGRLRRTSFALLGMTQAVIWTLSSVFTDLGTADVATLAALTLPALVVPALLWNRALGSRLLPIERYLDAAVRHPGARGPARDDPTAVEAFRAAQSLPYILAAYQAAGLAAAAAVVVAIGRTLAGFDAAAAARLLSAVGLVCVAVGLYETLLLRDVLRPLLGQLGARHRLTAAEVRSPLSLRTKLVGFFGSVTVFTSGLVLLFALSPAREATTLVGSVLLGVALALGLMLLILRDLVAPIQALEARSDEMARGELARPVPPSGEADEIGRLTFAFEEMRRALRDKLRSTESLNIDLEREVQRRTEALEQRNRDLHEALEKLRRAQDDLIRTEKLASMGRLVAGIAHEINNPVNAVINTIGPLEELVGRIARADSGVGAAAQAAGEAERMLAVIQRGAARTKAIVQALHNYSRGDDETLREVNLVRSVDDTIDLLRHRLKGVEITKEIEPGLRVTGFAGQIDQVLMNLVTNAAQAVGDRGGHIRIATAREGGGVVLMVSDDGPGIPPDVLPRIFDPFFTTKDVGEGSGLGLSIVHGIVERHGGRIEVKSELGQGTTFRVFLPVQTGHGGLAPGIPGNPGSGAGAAQPGR